MPTCVHPPAIAAVGNGQSPKGGWTEEFSVFNGVYIHSATRAQKYTGNGWAGGRVDIKSLGIANTGII